MRVSRYSTYCGGEIKTREDWTKEKLNPTYTEKKEIETVSSGTKEEWMEHRGGKERKGVCKRKRERGNQRGDVVLDKLRMWHACGEGESRYKQERERKEQSLGPVGR